MYKKSRITSLKHKAKRLKRVEQRKLARRLIKGDLSLDQLDRLVGDGVKGVLKTVNYLNEVVGLSLSPILATAVTQVMAPATSGAVVSNFSGRPVPGSTTRRSRTAPVIRRPNKTDGVIAETTAVAEAPKRPRVRRAKAEPEEAETTAGAEAPKRPRVRRAKAEPEEAETTAVAEAPKRPRVRRAKTDVP